MIKERGILEWWHIAGTKPIKIHNHVAFMNKVTDKLRSFWFDDNHEESNDLQELISCMYYNIDKF